MDENTRERSVYYNVPRLTEAVRGPAAAVGAAVVLQGQNPSVVRIIIHRDPDVRLSSFTLLYRFSGQPLRTRDEEHPFFKFVYDLPDLNRKDYICLRRIIPENTPVAGCTVLISSVTLENGETIAYRLGDYEEPQTTCIGSDASLAEPELQEYFRYHAAAKASRTAAVPAGEPAVRKKTKKEKKAKPPKKISRRKKLIRRRAIENAAGITAVIVIGLAVISVGIMRALPGADSSGSASSPENRLAVMLAANRYSEAYQLVTRFDDERVLQEVCEKAAEHYQFVKNFEKAYLYAAAAPRPFDGDVIDAFADYFISQNRHADAVAFLKKQDGYDAALQKVCDSAVRLCLAEADYTGALSYAETAPESLESMVYDHAADALLGQGTIDAPSLSILSGMSDEEAFDSIILQKMEAADDLTTEFSLAIQLKSKSMRAERVKELCVRGMKSYVDAKDLGKAGTFYKRCSKVLDETGRADCLKQISDYCYTSDNTAGTIYFTALDGGDTSSFTVRPEDAGIREYLQDVYFLLNAQQKRAYHAVSFDLYKEAYRIRNGALEGTDITDAVSVSTFEYQTIVLHTDGTVSAIENDGHNKVLSLPADRDIVQIAAGLDHAAFLHDDGTVTVAGSNALGQCGTGGWKSVVRIAAGADFTAGLLADGTLVACGSNLSGQCEVGRYTDVCDIAACDQSLVILFKDGSVAVAGDVSMGLKQAERFTQVRRIRAASSCILAERTNGTYLMAHSTANADTGSVSSWRKAEEFAAGSVCIGYVDASGEIHIKGDGSPVAAP